METVYLRSRPNDRLVGPVRCDRTVDIKVDGYLVMSPVTRLYFPAEVCNRPRHHFEIFRKRRCQKSETHLNLGTLHGNDSASWSDLSMGFFQCRDRAIRIAEISISLSVDANQPIEFLRDSRPMLGGPVGQSICRGPNTEIGVMHDKRSRRGP